MSNAGEFLKAVFKYKGTLENDENGRERTWEHCYYNFYKARNEEHPDMDYLSLHLAFYLASWGMFRGSSFLLEKDYKVHIPVVETILSPEYDILLGADCDILMEENNRNLLKKLSDTITKYYHDVRCTVKGDDVKSPVSEILITKILMGTLGCVPAYDGYFVKAIRENEVTIGTYNMESLTQLCKHYKKNCAEYESARRTMWVEDVIYPQMKLLDMGFWQIGKDAKENER